MHHVDADTDESGARGDHGRGEEVSQHEVVVLSNLLATMQWHDFIIKFSIPIHGGPSAWRARLGLIGLIGTDRAGGEDGGTSKTSHQNQTIQADGSGSPCTTKRVWHQVVPKLLIQGLYGCYIGPE